MKTRLAATLGDEAALRIYEKLLTHTHRIIQPLLIDKFIFYADKIIEDDRWCGNGYYKALQADAGLGNRMQKAFERVFQKGYEKISIIGSDCYELTTALIENAFQLLNTHDVVLGPANDGGYYLLAMKDGVKNIFQTIDWSTGKVLTQTLQRIRQNNYTYTLLPLLTDVDTADDVPAQWKKELKLI